MNTSQLEVGLDKRGREGEREGERGRARARARAGVRKRERVLVSLVPFQLYCRMNGWLWDEQRRFSDFAGTLHSLFCFPVRSHLRSSRGIPDASPTCVTDGGGWWMVDGGGWWMVDGGWWWMVDGGGWVPKRFSDFSQNFVR